MKTALEFADTELHILQHAEIMKLACIATCFNVCERAFRF